MNHLIDEQVECDDTESRSSVAMKLDEFGHRVSRHHFTHQLVVDRGVRAKMNLIKNSNNVFFLLYLRF